MFAFKNYYYLYIENTKILNLNSIKKRNRFIVIYRNARKNESIEALIKFRRKCKERGVLFFVANEYRLVNKLNADGLYLSAHNNSFKYLNYKNHKLIIGSAHNFKEISNKRTQGCKKVILSRLFKTDYKNKRGYLGVIRFNLIINNEKNNIIPLGGIRLNNLNYLKIVRTNSFAILSEIKKKPAISSRLF